MRFSIFHRKDADVVSLRWPRSSLSSFSATNYDRTMLARFRADPRKVRVSIRRDGAMWVAVVSDRVGSGPRFEAVASGPRKALVKALLLADADGLSGVDLSMGWAYEHPQRALSHVTVVGVEHDQSVGAKLH